MNAPPEKATPGCNRANAEPQLEDAASILPADTAPSKRLATLAAKLALKGYSLHATAGGAYIVSRWDRSVVAADLDAVEGFLVRAGVRP